MIAKDMECNLSGLEQVLPPPPPCRVLLVEDDMDDCILQKKELMASEYVSDVLPFKDGKALTDYMKDCGFMDHSVMLFTPVLLLVDIEMPRKNGLEVIRELKSDPFLNPIPLISITGTESEIKIRQAKDLGASGVFKKPFDRHTLDAFFRDAWKWPPPELWC